MSKFLIVLNSYLLLPAVIGTVSLASVGCFFHSKVEPPNTLHLVAVEKIKGLDPIFADDLYSGLQSSQAYEPLLQYHYLKRPYVLTPNLIEAMPGVSSDGKTYTFNLKKGILFQDDPCFKVTGGKGRELVANDVVYSLKRLADPKLGSSGWWILDERVVGLNAWRTSSIKSPQTNYGQEVEGLRALDRYTVQIKLTQKSAQFLYLLAMPAASIVAEEAVETYGKEFLNHAVGTGPFKLAEYNPNSRIVWVRNPTYRKDFYPAEGSIEDREMGLLRDAGKQLPLVDELVVQVIVEQQPMWLNFLSGKLDLSTIPKDNFSSAISSNHDLNPELLSKGISLIKSPGLDVTHMTFNMADSLLGKNKYLRQAISLAYDQNTYNDIFYNGRAMSAQGPIPPGIEGYNSNLKNPYRKFNIAKAKEYLAKAGYPGGKGLPALEYAALAGSSGRQQSEFTEKSMSALGIKLNISSYSWPQFLEVVKNRKAQLWEYSWEGDYPDAENFLQLFYSKNSSPGPNDSNYSSVEFDRLYEDLLKIDSVRERTVLYDKMVNLLIEDCPWVFGSHRLGYRLVQKWLKNYKPNDFSHSIYKYYRVDSSLKR